MSNVWNGTDNKSGTLQEFEWFECKNTVRGKITDLVLSSTQNTGQKIPVDQE